MRLFTVVIYQNVRKKLHGLFVPAKPFQPSLIFLRKAEPTLEWST